MQVSHAVRSKAPTATRGIQALQELLGDPHLRGLEILTLGQAISQHNSAMCETEAGAEVLCSVLRKVVSLHFDCFPLRLSWLRLYVFGLAVCSLSGSIVALRR